MLNVLLVALGGGLGAAGRYGVSLTAPAQPGEWPLATFAINVVGSLLIGAAQPHGIISFIHTPPEKR